MDDILIWRYIDGSMDDLESANFERQLKIDADLKKAYESRLLLHESMKHLTLSHPSYSFTAGVENRISQLNARTKSDYNLGFPKLPFLMGVLLIIAALLPSILKLSQQSTDWMMSGDLISNIFTSNLALFFGMGIFTWTILVLLDAYLSKKKESKTPLAW